MSERTIDRWETRAAELLASFMPYVEEHNPLPEDPSPGMLVGRVTERLAQAGFELEQFKKQRLARRRGPASLQQVGVYFISAATFAIDAVPHVHPEGKDASPPPVKEALLKELDERVLEAISVPSRAFQTAREDGWLATTLATLVGACDATAELEGVFLPYGPAGSEGEEEDRIDGEVVEMFDPEFGDEDDVQEEDDEDDFESLLDQDEDDWDPKHLRSEIADSLFDAAVRASIAASWFINRHQEMEYQRRRRREAARERRTASGARRR